jgi:hypothetical protein
MRGGCIFGRGGGQAVANDHSFVRESEWREKQSSPQRIRRRAESAKEEESEGIRGGAPAGSASRARLRDYDKFGTNGSLKMNSKQAKDFLAQQTAEQAAREGVPLSDIEKRMMYFTESDAASCDDPIELNAEFEKQYDNAEYEAKISRLLHHAYDGLKLEDPGRKRTWDDAIRTLRKGDHYLLVLWDIKPKSEHPTRDFFKLLGVGMLIAVGIGIATFFSVKYHFDSDRFTKYVMAVVLGICLLATGTLRTLYRATEGWFHQKKRRDDELD